MTRVIAVANNKGGVAKTTTAGNLAHGLMQTLIRPDGEVEGRILIVDLDTQGNQADFFGVRDRVYNEQKNPDGACLSNLINDANCPAKDYVISLDRSAEGFPRPNLYLIPATKELGYAIEAIAAVDSVTAYQATISRSRKPPAVKRQLETILSDRFARIKNNFDYIILDCPPNLDSLKVAVYDFADEVIVPVKADRLSAVGSLQHTEDIVNMIKEHGLDVKISMIVPTMMRPRQILDQQTVDSLKKRYGASRVATPIPESVAVKESPAANGQTLFEYAPKSKPAIAYMDLVKKVANG